MLTLILFSVALVALVAALAAYGWASLRSIPRDLLGGGCIGQDGQ